MIDLRRPSDDGQGRRAAGALYAQVKPQDANPARTPISRGTKGSNPLPSSGESGANPDRKKAHSDVAEGISLLRSGLAAFRATVASALYNSNSVLASVRSQTDPEPSQVERGRFR